MFTRPPVPAAAFICFFALMCAEDDSDDNSGSDSDTTIDTDSDSGSDSDTDSGTDTDYGCLKGGDYAETGPYELATMKIDIPTKGPYTVYYPKEMEDSCKHPIVAWGNGYLMSGTSTYGFINKHLASWGFVVIAAHQDGAGDGTHHEMGLDWLIEQNENSESEFYHRLNLNAGVSGHSEGGQGANEGADHPNVRVVGCIQCIQEGCSPVDPSTCGDPVVDDRARLCLTGTQDTARVPTYRAYDATDGPAFLANWNLAGHFTPMNGYPITQNEREARKQYLRLHAAWYRCFLADDSNACALFRGGENCEICDNKNWKEIKSKGID